MDSPITPFDLTRMFIGDQPPLFFLEIVVRTVLIYGYTFLLVRWVGGRSIAQLSVVEFILVIALGSAVGDPFFYPDVPILHALTAITVVVLINKGLDFLILRSSSVQRKIDGVPILVVKDGRLLDHNARDRGIGEAEIYEQLRMSGISDLGQISEAYLETSGNLSVFKADIPMATRAIVPPPETGTQA
ncbi:MULTISPECIES: DUF421 domain-containing protein [unclassified Hoeflea]|uniref:DUF421 domain-containing protein n=1 Tax=unclassified Hoeflea TaxID=2614931 RepID=UPI00398FCEF4